MRKDLAIDINIGDKVYNCFMESLTVLEKTVFNNDNGSISCIKFIVKDQANNTHVYECEDLYLSDLDDEDDSEKSWVDWAKDNKDFFELFDHISTMKEIYKIGFANGFEYKRQLKFMEAVQK